MGQKSEKMPKWITVMWIVFIAAYAVWMIFFMRGAVLEKYETLAQRTVDSIVHNDITGMTGSHWLYPVWVIVSCISLALFPVYIKIFLFSDESESSKKLFCLINLIIGFSFITFYTFLKNPKVYTASMIGLDFPWCFKLWGIWASLSVFTNTLYMYNKYGYFNRLGIVCGSIGCAAIFITINVPSAGEELVPTLRCISHWTGALVFAFGCAAPMVLFLLNRTVHKDKRFTVMFVVFAAILVTMIVLLVTVGKDGIIESLPVWAAYAVLFLANFTNIFTPQKAEEKELAYK